MTTPSDEADQGTLTIFCDGHVFNSIEDFQKYLKEKDEKEEQEKIEQLHLARMCRSPDVRYLL